MQLSLEGTEVFPIRVRAPLPEHLHPCRPTSARLIRASAIVAPSSVHVDIKGRCAACVPNARTYQSQLGFGPASCVLHRGQNAMGDSSQENMLVRFVVQTGATSTLHFGQFAMSPVQ